jgi:DNA mismatch endonuclease (patch repair protein)
MDKITKEQRSALMAHVKGKNTKPELKLRKYLWNQGLRSFRVKNSIFGKPDIFLPKYGFAIFVDGCFWHRCPKCKGNGNPETNSRYWQNKFRDNKERDIRVNEALKGQGIGVYRIWEHEIKGDIRKCFIKLIIALYAHKLNRAFRKNVLTIFK